MGEDRELEFRKVAASALEAMQTNPHILSVVNKMKDIQPCRSSLDAIGKLVQNKLRIYAKNNTEHFNSTEAIIDRMSNDFNDRLIRVKALLPDGSESEVARLVFDALLIGPYVKTPWEILGDEEKRRRDSKGKELRGKRKRSTESMLFGAIREVFPNGGMAAGIKFAKQCEEKICEAAGVEVGSPGYGAASIKRAIAKISNKQK